jgi:TonB family protein
MDRQDEEFEAFLRQFQPRKPAAAPGVLTAGQGMVRRPWMIAAAAILVCGAIPIALLWKTPAANDVTSSPVLSSVEPDRPRAIASSGPLRAGKDVDPPRIIEKVEPVYPPEAQEAGVEGRVLLDIIIATDGTVTDVHVLRSVPMLDQAAIDAVSQWRYEPTLVEDVPVEVEMNVFINFTLANH